MHYNENADRDQATTTTGQAVFKFPFPKSIKGECTAKPVKTVPTYSMFKKIFTTIANKYITVIVINKYITPGNCTAKVHCLSVVIRGVRY